jgi:arylsulfatase A-like enzyme
VGLSTDEKTIAGLLKERGYATMIVGKWHCGDQPEFLPTRHGFEHYYGIPFSNDMGRQAWKKPGRYPPLPLLDDEEVIEEQPEQEGLTERYVERCVRFIRENRENPFFLYLAHMHVHRPILVARRFAETAKNGRYGAAVECIDWAAGMLFYELKKLGIDRNTLVVFTSDNGSRGDLGGSNGPLRGGKGTTWEGGQRLPFIARWPGQIPAGRTNAAVMTSMDFLPTFASLAGTSAPDDRMIDGKDIRPLLLGEEGAASPHDAFFYYRLNTVEAVRSGRWKLHVRKHDDEMLELYNLEEDIGETTNVADRHPDVVADLKARLQACREDLGDEATGVEGANCRPIGRVDEGRTLTEYDPDCPYICAEYDTPEAG